jgi:hypothetical protein
MSMALSLDIVTLRRHSYKIKSENTSTDNSQYTRKAFQFFSMNNKGNKEYVAMGFKLTVL